MLLRQTQYLYGRVRIHTAYTYPARRPGHLEPVVHASSAMRRNPDSHSSPVRSLTTTVVSPLSSEISLCYLRSGRIASFMSCDCATRRAAALDRTRTVGANWGQFHLLLSNMNGTASVNLSSQLDLCHLIHVDIWMCVVSPQVSSRKAPSG